MSLNGSFNFKIFDSLKCTLCKAPFIPLANHQLSPRKLGCGLAMCNECFEREKAAKKHGKHQCDHENCFHNTKPAHFLIDILSHDSLKLSTILGGYYLAKPFNIPNCPICGDKYSNEISGKKSFVLNCNHMICTKCYQIQEKKPTKMNEWKFTIKCPTCEFVTKSDVYTRKDRFQNFLDELPKMNQQFEARLKLNHCAGCQEQNTADKMFYCLFYKCRFVVLALIGIITCTKLFHYWRKSKLQTDFEGAAEK
ncbi:unnamed protein product, partial [Mesorhabditis belari]|uniref:RING-type domain-containing protein n=1 Tax=Mesorhabditis belari TaxID=2138241 RepID=A0AAF3EJS4_9BILA